MEKEKKNNNLVVIILFVLLMISLVLGAVGLMNKKEKPSDNTPTPVEPGDGGEEGGGGDYAPIVDDYSIMLTGVKDIFLAAQQQWILDSVEAVTDKSYSYCQVGGCGPTLTVDNTEIDYYILLNNEGSITKYYATNGKYQYKYEGNSLSIEDIDSLNTIVDLPEEEVITIVPNM